MMSDRHKRLSALLIGLKPMKGGPHHDEAEDDEETPEEEHSEGEYSVEDCASEMFDALQSKDKEAYVKAVSDLVEHLKEEDAEQDKEQEEEG